MEFLSIDNSTMKDIRLAEDNLPIMRDTLRDSLEKIEEFNQVQDEDLALEDSLENDEESKEIINKFDIAEKSIMIVQSQVHPESLMIEEVQPELKEMIIKVLLENDEKHVKMKQEEERGFTESHRKMHFFLKDNIHTYTADEYNFLLSQDERQFKTRLPIYQRKYEIINSIKDNRVTLVVCDTGAGKTTQIVQYCLALGNKWTPILCSQPRKISTVNSAKRVANESGLEDNNEVIARYNSYLGMKEEWSGRIQFLNESVLLNELIVNPYLKGYSILVVDEAHERSLNLDVILFFVKHYALTREDFKLIITSATINCKQIEDYFLPFKPYKICGSKQNQNISIVYTETEINPIMYPSTVFNFFQENIEPIFSNNIIVPQTILVFLPDLKSIHSLNKVLTQYFETKINEKKLYVFELFGSLTYEEQAEIIHFNQGEGVKVILSTNVAETSITIENCNIVIDSGLQKTRKYNYKSKMLEDQIEVISKDSANQRAGRCGRVQHGTCYRLYTESQYLNMRDFRLAEISRVNISYMILKLIFFGLRNIFDVELIEQPPKEEVDLALTELEGLSAIEIKENPSSPDVFYSITPFGKWLYKIQIEPLYGRVLYNVIYKHRKALAETITLISSLSLGDCLFWHSNQEWLGPRFLAKDLEESRYMQCQFTQRETYIKNLTSHIISEVLDEEDRTEGYMKNLDFVSAYYEVFALLHPFFNIKSYHMENPICSLGDLMIHLYYIRQYKRIICRNHLNQIFQNGDFNSVKDNKHCENCNTAKNYFIYKMGFNKKYLQGIHQVEENLRHFLKINDIHCDQYHGLSIECAKNEYIIAEWTSLYTKIISLDSNLTSPYLRENIHYILFKLKTIDLRQCFDTVYAEYKNLYIDVIGYSFVRTFSYNMAFKPFIITPQGENEIKTEFYLMLASEEKCILSQRSQYNLYMMNHSQIHPVLFAIQVVNMSDISLQNINPIFVEMAEKFPRNILNECKNVYLNRKFVIFSIQHIGSYIYNFLLDRRRQLEKTRSDELYNSNALSKILPKSCFISQKSTMWFLTDKINYISDKFYIEAIVSNEKKSIREHSIDEIGCLSKDCLILKLQQGLNVIGVEYNKDQIHFEIVILKEDNSLSLYMLENMLLSRKMYFHKIYMYRNKLFISFKNSIQSCFFMKNLKQDPELCNLILIKRIGEEYVHSYAKQDTEIVLSLLTSLEAPNNMIFDEISQYGHIEDILIRQSPEYKIVHFMMSTTSEANNIRNNFYQHEKYGISFSEVKQISKNLTIDINRKACNLQTFWEELARFCLDNEIFYHRIGKTKLLLENTSDYVIRKLLSFISEDVIILNDFAISEIRANAKDIFYKKKGLDFRNFCMLYDVFVEVFYYFNKVHIYGAPSRREIVKNIINEYYDKLKSEYENQIFPILLDQVIAGNPQLQNHFSKKIFIFLNQKRTEYYNMGYTVMLNYSYSKQVVDIEGRRMIVDEIKKNLQTFIDEEMLSLVNALIVSPLNVNQVSSLENCSQCSICLDQMCEKNIVRLGLCGDIFCRDCLRNQVYSCINSQPVANLPIKCLKCGDIILNTDILAIFSQSEQQYIFYQLIKYFKSLPKGRDYSWCENPECQFIYKKSTFINADANIRYCTNCQKTFCLLCGTEVINNIHNQDCKIYILKKLNQEDRSWLLKNTKNCPKCNQLYEKSEGCNHMTCRKCQPEVHFCYICGKVLNKENPERHFSEASNIYCYNNLYANVEKTDISQIEDKIQIIPQSVPVVIPSQKPEEKSQNNSSLHRFKMVYMGDDVDLAKDIIHSHHEYFNNIYQNQEFRNYINKKTIHDTDNDSILETNSIQIQSEEPAIHVKENLLEDNFYDFIQTFEKTTNEIGPNSEKSFFEENKDDSSSQKEIPKKVDRKKKQSEVNINEYFADYFNGHSNNDHSDSNEVKTPEVEETFSDYFQN